MDDCCGTYLLAAGIMVVIMIFMWLKQAAQEKADTAENKSGSVDYVYERNETAGVIGGTNLDRFFVECVLSECNDFSKEKNVARAKLLADKYNISYAKGIEAVYNTALKAHEAISGKIDDEKLAKKRAEEQEEFARLNRYSEYYGKEKKAAMLRDRMGELLNKAANLDEASKMLLRSTQQQERDWATWGGIASGIAGPGAGISTALEIQAQNAQIRAQNEANMRAAMPAYMSATGNASQLRTNANTMQKQIDLLREKLISEMPTEEVMQYLDVINPTIDISETGAFKVTATVKAEKDLFIFGDVPAVVDGTLVAHVFDEGKEIGTAKMVLPVEGVTDKVGVVGAGLSGAERNKKYNITFTAYKLWMMEK